jgi:CHAT domain-containing protein
VELLELYLSPIDQACFKVIATSSLGIKGDIQSNVPFRQGRTDRHLTVLKTLEAISFRCEDFLVDGEQDWMVETGLLAQDRKAFHPKSLETIGKILYNTVFLSGKRVRNVLEKSLAKANEKNTQLHIQLQFAPDDLQLVRLPDYPWELMHDGQRFLAHYQVTFSRYIADDTAPPNKSGVDQVKVLLVSSKAFDKDNKLDPLPEQEQQAIREALKAAEQEKRICLYQLENATFDELRTYLTQHRGNKAPHVFHFDGHGWFGKRCNNYGCRRIHRDAKADSCKICGGPLSEFQGYLLFEDKAGGAHYVSAKELGQLLQEPSYTGDGVALVVLSACQSALSLRSNSVFNGIAQNLISHCIPAVVAPQYKIEVSSASAFAKQFYLCLGEGDSLALAVSKARGAMGVEGNQWYRPVLYLRWKDNEGGQLFAHEHLLDLTLSKYLKKSQIN